MGASVKEGCLLSRQAKTIEQTLKPLFEVKVKLTESLIVSETVFKDDTPITICDRLVSKNQRHLGHLQKETRKLLQQYIEFEVNSYVKQLESVIKKHKQKVESKKREHEQIKREKRLRAAQRLGDAEHLYSSSNFQSLEQRPIVAKLQIIVGSNRKGEIIVRETQEDEASVSSLVKNFIVCYGLKKEMYPIIFSHLMDLIQQAKNQESEGGEQEDNQPDGELAMF